MAVDAGVVGFTRLCQRKHLIDYGPHLARVEQGADLAQLRTARCDNEVVEVHPGAWARVRRWGTDDRDHDSTLPHYLPRACQGVAAHQIKDDINVVHHVFKAGGRIVDDLISS